MHRVEKFSKSNRRKHGLRKPGEKIVFTARPKIQSLSQVLRYGQSIFCLPHRPKFSDFFDLFLHWMSVVRDQNKKIYNIVLTAQCFNTPLALMAPMALMSFKGG